ncbi:MAG: DNA repair protein RecN (Recombination protein N), partial [Planctomycetota bacterium]
MLIELSVRDLALIEAVTVELTPGLNVVTGETGAGKSLFVGALEMLLGLAPKGGAAQWVRKGAKQARVEGRLVISDAEMRARLERALQKECPEILESWREEQGSSDECELVIGRTLTKEGRTRAHLDQRPVPLRALRAVAPLMLEIHGQNDHQRLLLPGEQRRLVDDFGGLGKSVDSYRAAREVWRVLLAKSKRAEEEEAERRDRLDLLRYQASELFEARLVPGEGADLREERALLRSAGDLGGDLGGMLQAFSGEEGAMLDRLKSADHSLEKWSE